MKRETLPIMKGAIVIGGDYRGLGLVRSLGRRGIAVCVMTDEHAMAGLSRYTRYRMKWPSTAAETTKLDFLDEAAAGLGFAGWTLFPTGDETAALIARNHARLSKSFTLTTSPWEVFQWAYDKRLTYQLAAEIGVACPATWYPKDRAELEAINPDFPVLLKPATKRRSSRFTHDKAWIASSRDELMARYDSASLMIDPAEIMLQELIPGRGDRQFSFAAACDGEGNPVASILALRRRQYPIDFGYSSSYVESIAEPEIDQIARRILRVMRISGLVEIEFKRDARDGRLKLLDINPRVWGWHSLGARAGVDFGYLQWRLANGLTVAETRGRPGIRWIRLSTDFLCLMQQIRRGGFSPGEYLQSFRRPLEFGVWALGDPLPALSEIPMVSIARLRLWHHDTRGKLRPRAPSSPPVSPVDALDALQPHP